MNKEMLETFLEIAKVKTISEAARNLYVSQSTVSHRLQMLERELGAAVFERQRGIKKMTLTKCGERFYPMAMQWLELDNSMMQIQSSASSLGKLTIGSMTSINQYLLAPFIHDIVQGLPEIQFEFVTYHSQEIYGRLPEQQIDIGFAFYPVHHEITAAPMFREPIFVVTAPDSRYPKGELTPQNLRKSDQILFPWNDELIHWNNEWWDELEAPYAKVDAGSLLTAFLTDPDRWALCPASMAMSLLAEGLAELHPLTVKPPDRVCYMLQRKTPRGSVQACIELFTEYFAGLVQKSPWYDRKI